MLINKKSILMLFLAFSQVGLISAANKGKILKRARQAIPTISEESSLGRSCSEVLGFESSIWKDPVKEIQDLLGLTAEKAKKAKKKQYDAARYENKTSTQKKARLERDRLHHAALTLEEKLAIAEKKKQSYEKMIARETPARREIRLERQRRYDRMKKAAKLVAHDLVKDK